jgi:hypothetical protein
MKLGCKELVTHFAGDSRHIVVVTAKSDMHRHSEFVCNLLSDVQSGPILEIEVIFSGRVIVEIVADQKDLFNRTIEAVEKIAHRGQTFARVKHAFGVFGLFSGSLAAGALQHGQATLVAGIQTTGAEGHPTTIR